MRFKIIVSNKEAEIEENEIEKALELISKGGIVVEPDPVEISKALTFLLKDPKLLKYCQRKGRTYTLRNFNLESVATRLIKSFNNLFTTYLARRRVT